MEKKFEKKYSVAIDTVPLPEEPAERIDVALNSYGPVILQIVRDMMNVALGKLPINE